MAKKSVVLLRVVAIVLLILSSGCSILPQGVRDFLASPTPTETKTPTATATSTVTSTPVNTPLPPIQFEPCLDLDFCYDEYIKGEILSTSQYQDAVNYIEVPYDKVINFAASWLVKDQSILDQTMPHIRWVFTIDGHDYFNSDYLSFTEIQDQNDPSILYPSFWVSMNLSGWKIGEAHTIVMGIYPDAIVNDGWGDLAANTRYVITYIVTPVESVASTPTPRIVPPSSGPSPTPRPACSVDSIIRIENTTGAWITISLSGPAQFRFDLGPGNSTIDVCPGSYNYTVWGCGGASRSDSASSGDTVEVYCQ